MAGFDPANASIIGKLSTVENSERMRPGSRKGLLAGGTSGSQPRGGEAEDCYTGTP